MDVADEGDDPLLLCSMDVVDVSSEEASGDPEVVPRLVVLTATAALAGMYAVDDGASSARCCCLW